MYKINLIKDGSDHIYSKEKICTKKEINKTKTSIIVESVTK